MLMRACGWSTPLLLAARFVSGRRQAVNLSSLLLQRMKGGAYIFELYFSFSIFIFLDLGAIRLQHESIMGEKSFNTSKHKPTFVTFLYIFMCVIRVKKLKTDVVVNFIYGCLLQFACVSLILHHISQ